MRTRLHCAAHPSVLHAAGSRDLIRVHGARVNTLKAVSVAIRSAG